MYMFMYTIALGYLYRQLSWENPIFSPIAMLQKAIQGVYDTLPYHI